ncbi:sesquipedalian [Anaeramoeba ignava]|uniref:Sesquipedalian n=1 Tax=Anaeramoeba ignava TaxID=1746090 RepID=A0A9Q0LVA9_ANAIG|nr:sesquipedalian [Anaeramoeba ignava]
MKRCLLDKPELLNQFKYLFNHPQPQKLIETKVDSKTIPHITLTEALLETICNYFNFHPRFYPGVGILKGLTAKFNDMNKLMIEEIEITLTALNSDPREMIHLDDIDDQIDKIPLDNANISTQDSFNDNQNTSNFFSELNLTIFENILIEISKLKLVFLDANSEKNCSFLMKKAIISIGSSESMKKSMFTDEQIKEKIKSKQITSSDMVLVKIESPILSVKLAKNILDRRVANSGFSKITFETIKIEFSRFIDKNNKKFISRLLSINTLSIHDNEIGNTIFIYSLLIGDLIGKYKQQEKLNQIPSEFFIQINYMFIILDQLDKNICQVTDLNLSQSPTSNLVLKFDNILISQYNEPQFQTELQIQNIQIGFGDLMWRSNEIQKNDPRVLAFLKSVNTNSKTKFFTMKTLQKDEKQIDIDLHITKISFYGNFSEVYYVFQFLLQQEKNISTYINNLYQFEKTILIKKTSQLSQIQFYIRKALYSEKLNVGISPITKLKLRDPKKESEQSGIILYATIEMLQITGDSLDLFKQNCILKNLNASYRDQEEKSEKSSTKNLLSVSTNAELIWNKEYNEMLQKDIRGNLTVKTPEVELKFPEGVFELFKFLGPDIGSFLLKRRIPKPKGRSSLPFEIEPTQEEINSPKDEKSKSLDELGDNDNDNGIEKNILPNTISKSPRVRVSELFSVQKKENESGIQSVLKWEIFDLKEKIARSKLQIKQFVREVNNLRSSFDHQYHTSEQKISTKQVSKAGFLTKRGHKVKSWHSRWFILSHEKLRYFKNQQPKDEEKHTELPLGIINLRESEVSIPEQNIIFKRKCFEKEAKFKKAINFQSELFPVPTKNLKSHQENLVALIQNNYELIRERISTLSQSYHFLLSQLGEHGMI